MIQFIKQKTKLLLSICTCFLLLIQGFNFSSIVVISEGEPGIVDQGLDTTNNTLNGRGVGSDILNQNDDGEDTLNAKASSGTLTQCNFRSADGQVTNDSDAFQRCIGQVFQFIVVIAILLILFRIAISALKAYNPASSGDADTIKNSQQIVIDIVLGLFFIGGPYLILTTINPALTNFQLVDFTGVFSNIAGGSGGSSGQDGGGGGTSTSGSSGQNISLGGNATSFGMADTLKILNDPNAEIFKEDGKTPLTAQEKETIQQNNIPVANDYYLKCNRNLIPDTNSSSCKTYGALEESIRTQMSQVALKADSTINQKAQNDSYSIKSGFNDLYVNNSLSLVPYSSDPQKPYGQISVAIDPKNQNADCTYYFFLIKYDQKPSNFLDNQTESYSWRTMICPDTTQNSFFEKQGTTWKLKTNKYAKGTTIKDIYRP